MPGSDSQAIDGHRQCHKQLKYVVFEHGKVVECMVSEGIRDLGWISKSGLDSSRGVGGRQGIPCRLEGTNKGGLELGGSVRGRRKAEPGLGLIP